MFYWGSDLVPDRAKTPGSRPLTIIYAGSFGEGYDLATVLEAARMLAATPNVLYGLSLQVKVRTAIWSGRPLMQV